MLILDSQALNLDIMVIDGILVYSPKKGFTAQLVSEAGEQAVTEYEVDLGDDNIVFYNRDEVVHKCDVDDNSVTLIVQ